MHAFVAGSDGPAPCFPRLRATRVASPKEAAMMHRGLLALLALGFSLTWAPEARATYCSAGCAAISHDCRWAANLDKLGCRYECKGNQAGSDCTDACAAVARAARAACVEDRDSCRLTECAAAGECGNPCGQTADECADPPGAALRASCIASCKAGFGEAKAACPAGDDACLLDALADLGTCLHGCADQVEQLGADCQTDFDGCLAACGG